LTNWLTAEGLWPVLTRKAARPWTNDCFGLKDRGCEQLVFTLTADRFGHVEVRHEWLLTGDELGNR
jgi:hypothetical protein